MYILEGFAAILLGVALYGWAIAATRRAVVPGWARNQFFASSISLALVALAPLGVGLVILGATQPLTLASYAGIAGLFGAVGLLWWEVRR